MIRMLDRVRIRILREAGHTLAEIAANVGVGKRSVQRVLREPAITSVASAPTPASRGIGRPSQVEHWRADVERILGEQAQLPTVEILSRLRDLGYRGGKSAVYELVKGLRVPKPDRPEVRFEGVPGEFSQHDFGSVSVTYADGVREKLHFFASRLKYSRWTHVVVVPNEKVEPLIRALLLAFESFGGVPLRAVIDYVSGHIIEHQRPRHAAEVPEGVLQAADEVLRRLAFNGFAVGLARAAQDDAEDVRAFAFAVRGDDRGPAAEVHLGLIARRNLDPPEGQRLSLLQPAAKALDGVVSAGKALLATQVLPDALGRQTMLQSRLDGVAEGLATAGRAGGAEGRVWLVLMVRPGGQVWLVLTVPAGLVGWSLMA
jgi:transposase